MRTLKRTLCLVLALAMVLSFGAISVSATDFTDIDQSNHQEAAKVLNAIGIIEGYGYTNDELRPTANLTRAQAAKIATLLMGVDAENQSLPTAFSDVANTYWAKDFISYCAGEGILSGDSGIGGNFRPEANVTGVEFAKIMLGVLGYDAREEGLSYNESWAVTTTSLAMRIGILTNLADLTDFNAAITRDQAFQMAFNTLQANIVKYPTRSTVVAGEVTVVITGDAYAVEGNGTRAQSKGDYRTDKNSGAPGSLTDNDGYTQLCEQNFPDLEKMRARDEDFARPGTKWTYGGTDAVAFTPDATVATYNGTFNGKNAKALSSNGKRVLTQSSYGHDGEVAVYYNGSMPDTSNANSLRFNQDKYITGTGANNGLWLSDTAGIPGYEVEVYKHICNEQGCTVTYDVIVREAYLAQIVSKTEGNDKDHIKVAIYEMSKANAADNGAVTAYNYVVEPDDDIYASLNKFAKKDFLAIYCAALWENNGNTNAANTDDADYLLEAAALDKEAVTIRRIDDNGIKANSTVTIGTGTKYTINNEAMWDYNNAPGDVNKLTMDDGRKLTTGDAVLYTLNGSILFIDQSTEALAVDSGYGYVMDFKSEDTDNSNAWETEGGKNDSTTGSWVRILTTDGEIREMLLDDDTAGKFLNAGDATSGDLSDNARYNWLGQLVYFKYDSNDEAFALTRINGFKAGTNGELEITRNHSEAKVPKTDGGFVLDTGFPSTGSTNQLTVAFDSKTVFIVVSTKNVNKDTLRPTDKNKLLPDYAEEWAIYDIYNVPNFDTDNVYVSYAAPLTTDGDLNVANGAITTDNDIARVVLIRDAGTTATSGYYFVVGNGSETVTRIMLEDGSEIEYATYPAVIDGNLTTVNIQTRTKTATGAWQAAVGFNTEWPVYDSQQSPSNKWSSPGYPATGGTAYANNGKGVLFFKNPTIKTYEDEVLGSVSMITAYGVVLPNASDDNAVAATKLEQAENDHFKLTVSGNLEDFLVSATTSHAFTYDSDKGTIEEIDLDDIYDVATTTSPNDVYAIRTTDKNLVSALFLPPEA